MSIIQGSAMQGASRGFYPKTLTGSLRFNDDDSAYLSWTPTSAGNRKTWTFSAWVKRGAITGGNQDLFAPNIADQTQIWILSGGAIRFYQQNTSVDLQTTPVFRDHSAWYHFVFEVDTTQATASNRIKIYVNGEQITAFDTANYPSQNTDMTWNTTNEHRIGGASLSYLDGYLAEVFFIDGTAHDADAFGETKNGVWVPKNITATDFTMGTNGFHLTFEDDTEVEAFNTVLYRGQKPTVNSVTGVGFRPSMVWIKERDNTRSHRIYDEVRGAFLEVVPDSTAAEAYSENGLRSFDSDGFTVGNDTSTNANGSDYVAWCWDAGANNASTGHSSVTYTGTGTAGLTIKGFGFDPDLIWTKARSGTYSTRDHALYDSVRGANKYLESSTTDVEASTTGASFVKDGYKLGDVYHSNGPSTEYVAWAWDAGDGDPVSNTAGSITSTVKASQANGFSIVSWTGNATAGATIGHGLSSAPTFIIFKNRVDSSDWPVYHTDIGTDYAVYLNTTGAQDNRGVGFLNSTAPSSSVISLHTWNLNNGSGDGMIAYCWHDVTGKQKFGTYTGTGTAPSSLINTGFRPGFLMIKEVDGVDGWGIYDGSRNPLNSVSYLLQAQDSGAESSATANYVDFESNGFKVCTGGSNGNFLNESGKTYIYAAFAGSYSDYITDYNTDGSIDSRVKASDTTGFSIVSYEGNGTSGATVGHGLSSAPDLHIIKQRNGTGNWVVYNSTNGATEHMTLNSTNASSAYTGLYNDTEPTSSLITLGNDVATNSSGSSYIAYCWTATTGVSAFGSYSGNGSTDGPEVTTGFEPAMVILKNASNTSDWRIYDNTRDADKIGDKDLYPNSSSAEGSGSNAVQFNADGFKLIFAGGSGLNTSGNTYIYAAFADTREAAFWLDQSSNDNDWQPNNLDHNDTVSDSPTDNFATLNPLELASGFTLSDGNLTIATTTSGSRSSFGNFAPSSGKYYFEATVNVLSAVADWVNFGVAPVDAQPSQNPQSSGGGISFQDSGRLWVDGTETGSWANDWNVGDTLMCAFDVDTGKVWLGSNGTWGGSGNPTAGTNEAGTFTGLVKPLFGQSSGANRSATLTYNFGQQPFKYSPPE